MKAIRDFRVATPSETRDFGFDYWNRVADAEVLASAVFSLEVAETQSGATADASPATRLSGDPDIEASERSDANTIAVQRITGLVAGNKYRVICRVTTNNGQVLEIYSHVWAKVAA